MSRKFNATEVVKIYSHRNLAENMSFICVCLGEYHNSEIGFLVEIINGVISICGGFSIAYSSITGRILICQLREACPLVTNPLTLTLTKPDLVVVVNQMPIALRFSLPSFGVEHQ